MVTRAYELLKHWRSTKLGFITIQIMSQHLKVDSCNSWSLYNQDPRDDLLSHRNCLVMIVYHHIYTNISRNIDSDFNVAIWRCQINLCHYWSIYTTSMGFAPYSNEICQFNILPTAFSKQATKYNVCLYLCLYGRICHVDITYHHIVIVHHHKDAHMYHWIVQSLGPSYASTNLSLSTSCKIAECLPICVPFQIIKFNICHSYDDI